MSLKWPRRLKHSYALYGPKAEPADGVVTEVEALEGNKLVTRSIRVTEHATVQTIDEPRLVTLVDASDNLKLYPKGSLMTNLSHKAMRTWSAQITVEK